MARKLEYAKLDQDAAEAAMTWARIALRLLWDIEIRVQDEPPEWVTGSPPEHLGSARVYRDDKRARLWISPSRAARPASGDPIEVVMQLMASVFLQDGTDESPVCGLDYRLGRLLAKAYRAGVEP